MDYRREVEKHGSVRAAARANGVPETSFREKYKGVRSSGKACKKAETRTDIGGIRLNETVRIRLIKPSEGVKRRLFGLKTGVGYPVDDLAEGWGCSPATLRAHARRHDALRYVEVGPGDWVHCVMHPETAAQHGGE